jgi:hypothetical protein
MEKFFSKNVDLFFFENRKIRLFIGQSFLKKKYLTRVLDTAVLLGQYGTFT